MHKERNITTLPLDGGLLCLDFVNTVQTRMKPVFHEYLNDYYTFIEWCVKVDIITPKEAAAYNATGVRLPTKVKETHSLIITAREMLYEFFSAKAAGRPVPDDVLSQFNSTLSASLAHIGFENTPAGLQQTWFSEPDELIAPLWKVMRSAYEILMSPEIKYVKECSACGWLFLDKSKSHNRRWCNPLECGSIDKATRYYYREKAKRRKADKSD